MIYANIKKASQDKQQNQTTTTTTTTTTNINYIKNFVRFKKQNLITDKIASDKTERKQDNL